MNARKKSPMATIAADLGRKWLLDVSANGVVTIRKRVPGDVLAQIADPSAQGLPVFSTNTRREAEGLRQYHCHLARNRSGLYFLNEFDDGNVDDLVRVAEVFRASHAQRRGAA